MRASALEKFTYTPQEAAALAGMRLQRVQNALTDRALGRSFRPARNGRRRVDLAAVLTLAVVNRLDKVRIEPAALYDAFRRVGLPSAPVTIDHAVTIDAPGLLAPVIRNLMLYNLARTRIVSDKSIMRGLPIVRGTRIPARTLHARITGGDSMESVLEDYPYLDRETVEAAVLYVEANPQRGRPPRRAAPRRV